MVQKQKKCGKALQKVSVYSLWMFQKWKNVKKRFKK
jgi:hypothetical protein